jgi:transposase
MGQRTRILSQIVGVRGWKVVEIYFEARGGKRVVAVAGYDLPADVVLVLVMARRWAARCGRCFAIVHGRLHERCRVRRWGDLPWAGRRVVLEYAPERVKCSRCGCHAMELLGWADARQRQTRRLQQHLALDAFSMPISHVATKYGLSWRTVRRAEVAAIARWEQARPLKPLRLVGLDEKWLGRRHKRREKFVSIVSDLDTGEPVWIGYGRRVETIAGWLATLTPEQKADIALVACDMHRPFMVAVRADPELDHVPVVHDPFHIMKRAGEALTELRRQTFFRASAELRAVGRGTRWLVLRPWKRLADEERANLRRVFALNGKLARAYQTVEQLREALKAPDEVALGDAMWSVLRRTARRDNVPMRKLHDSLLAHMPGILALAAHRPPTGRIEALNGNWETLVRRGRGYRDHHYLLRKLRFLVNNPVRTKDGILRFLALGLTPPTATRAA